MIDLLFLQQTLQGCGDDALLAVRAIIRGDVDVVLGQEGTELVLQQEETLGAGAHDGVHLVASVGQLACDGVGDSQADAAADDCPGALAQVRGLAQGTGDVQDAVTDLVGGQHGRGLAYLHKDELDPSLLGIPVCEGEGNALARLVRTNHQELASVCMLGHIRCLDAELEHLLRKLSLFEDFVHLCAPLPNI